MMLVAWAVSPVSRPGAITSASGSATITGANLSNNSAVAGSFMFGNFGNGGNGIISGIGGRGRNANGGAIAMLAGNLRVTTTTFSSNRASGGSGGNSGVGKYLAPNPAPGCSVIPICSYVQFAGDSEHGGDGGEGAGGAIAIVLGVATVSGSTFNSTSASGGFGGFSATASGLFGGGNMPLTGRLGATGGVGRGRAVSNDGTLTFSDNAADSNTATGGSGGGGGAGPDITDPGYDFVNVHGGIGGVGGAARGGTLDSTSSLTMTRNSITQSTVTSDIGGAGGQAGTRSSCIGGRGGDGAIGGHAVGAAIHNSGIAKVTNTTISAAKNNGGNGGAGGYPTTYCYYNCTYQSLCAKGCEQA